jgi:pimeloyl-ACP methyl ester carboxylesterase
MVARSPAAPTATPRRAAPRRARRLLLALLAAPALGLLALAGVLAAWSRPGQPAPFLDAAGRPLPGSLSEKLRIPIGGVEQGLILRSKDTTKPVLLYLHGGMPDYFLARQSGVDLEDDFTVCWWEQRGVGLSYDPAIPRESLTVEQLTADTIELTNYLRHRFGQERIYLMGHSGGTFLGVEAIARAPELFHAYVGVAQMAHSSAPRSSPTTSYCGATRSAATRPWSRGCARRPSRSRGACRTRGSPSATRPCTRSASARRAR